MGIYIPTYECEEPQNFHSKHIWQVLPGPSFDGLHGLLYGDTILER